MIEARFGLSVRVEGDPSLISPDYRVERFKTASRVIPTPESLNLPAVAYPEDEEEEEAAEEAVESAADEKPSGKRKRRRRAASCTLPHRPLRGRLRHKGGGFSVALSPNDERG